MPRPPTPGLDGNDVIRELLHRSREPFTSTVAKVGLAAAFEIVVRAARRMVEDQGAEFGSITAHGVRDEGAIWLAGEDAARVFTETQSGRPEDAAAETGIVCARLFGAVAYRHPYFDGNKRTAFVAAALAGYYLGARVRPIKFDAVEVQVLALTAAEAPDDVVARWFGENVFIW